MMLEDRSLHSLEDRTYGARRSFVKLTRSTSNKVIFKALSADLQAAGDLQGAQRRSLIYLYVLMVSKKLPFCQYLSV
ncbi:MAG: hypothetical protein J6R26_00620 [Paludibacteraceae bacterium]|nr:hypothetical protein [Paludibacteraceae bacterium]